MDISFPLIALETALAAKNHRGTRDQRFWREAALRIESGMIEILLGMSDADVEIVRRSFEAWNAGDIQAMRGYYTEDVILETPITEFGRTFEGDDPIGRWIAEMRETWSEIRWDVERVFEGDGVVVSCYRSVSIGRHSGAEVVRDLTAVSRIRDGLIASERVFLDRDEALEVAGVRTPP